MTVPSCEEEPPPLRRPGHHATVGTRRPPSQIDAFDPRRGPSLDLHAEDREVGGLGLILVLDMVDVLKYRRVEEKNYVEVRVHLLVEDEKGDPSTGE